MTEHIARSEQMEWEHTEEGRARFARKRLGAASGAAQLGCSLMEVKPGAASWPRHAHLANEEGIFVLAGRGILQIGEEEVAIAAGNYIALLAGPAHAHALRNPSEDEVLRYLCVSTMREPDVIIYPDSDKIGVFGGSPPGGDKEARTLHTYLDAHATRTYWDGER